MSQRDDEQLRALIATAAKAVKGRGKAGDELRAFTEEMFADAAYEDLDQYTPHEIAALAENAWAFMATRKPGTHKIRVYNPVGEDGEGRLADVTVVEIDNDNMPFLVDSAMSEIADKGYEIHLVAHPILTVTRDKAGKRTGFHGGRGADGGKGSAKESLIHIHVGRIDSDLARRRLSESLSSVFDDVETVVADWKPMRERLNKAIATYKKSPPPIPVDEIAEAVQFLEWLVDNNFTFLGMREYAFVGGSKKGTLEPVEERGKAGLGLLRDPDVKVLRRGREFVTYTPEVREFLQQPVPLIIAKANVKSTVHRRVYLDYVGVKTFDDNGKLTGELRVVGLLTSGAYNRSVRFIPYLRRKADLVMDALGYEPDSHSGKALWNVLETFPRDELFQIDLETLTEWAHSILKLGERPRIRVLTRVDKFDRFVSALVYVPRDRFTTEVRLAIGDLLARTYKGHVSAAYPSFPEGNLARVHFIIGRREGETPRPDPARIEAEIGDIVRTWSDTLREALSARHDALVAAEFYARYREAFTPAYRAAFQADSAVDDIGLVEMLSAGQPLVVDFYEPDKADVARIALKVFHHGDPIPLSERVPILENLGFRVINERSFRIDKPVDGKTQIVWLHDMVLLRGDGGAVDLDELGDHLEAAYLAVAKGHAENDGYNALVLVAGLMWRDVAMLRAYSRYLRQIRVPYSQDYMWATLVRHMSIARLLVQLFHARHNPEKAREDDVKSCLASIEAALNDVASLDEDSILRRFANLIMATQRANFFQLDTHGTPKPTIAFKLASRTVDAMPAPKPMAEIFVYSPRVEGVHLRFGKIARGGLRWSDRPQDFRTEVLGLVKAQQVKNAVIVPVGSKGGFVPKQPPASGNRDEVLAEGIACYKLFVSTLLDLTDNLEHDKVVRPQRVVCHDGEDPYLVVAADKGTATFSDIANEISQAHDFWLGDAFASGGSAGYDHKKMGITARGGWEAVKRHFRERNIDIQTRPFSVVGVGDMSGDVFGNGMLLSKAIRLLAAFDHRDIFIDPDPDPEKTWEERKRLFELPRSSWQDYDRKLISKGGGIFSRKEKSIQLTAEIRALLDIEEAAVSPNRLMTAILRARADLLWFGGIGTYVRASGETDDQVGDRANDAIRIAGRELRVQVVGEGANLGMTQRGRIEFARQGGRLNTDAIDNSAGVNCSDVEVNIKIPLGMVVREGRLTMPQRNKLLASMTEEVAGLVLRNNYLQTLAISLAERRGTEDVGFAERFMDNLGGRDLLDREIEFLPSNAELQERVARGEALHRPEIAVLLAYAKIDLYGQLLESRVPSDPYLGRELMRYFPQRLQAKYADAIEGHRLRREIIATMLANSMINRGGPTFVTRIADQTGATIDEIAHAFAMARDSFAMTDLNGEIDALDNRIDGELQLQLYADVEELLLQQVAWHVRNTDSAAPLAEQIGHYRDGLDALSKNIAKILPVRFAEALGARAKRYEDGGVPAPLAARLAALPWLGRGPDIVATADRARKPLPAVGETFFAVGDAFHIGPLIDAARALDLPDYYDRIALSRTVDGLAAAQRDITARVIEGGGQGSKGLKAWIASVGDDAARAERMIDDIANGNATLSKVAVAASLLSDLVA
ncbi:MAG: NAD-glutamate dehydrogenase [Flavobacteriaceae bacterium]